MGKDRTGAREANYKRRGARYRARRRAVDLLFEAEQRSVDAEELVADRIELARDPEAGVAPVPEYAEEIVIGVAREILGIDDTIVGYLSEEWPLHRLPAVDRAILRIGTWELFHNPDVPPRVAVVEAVELAAEYSTDVAPPYINAVLDSAADVADQARLAAAAVVVPPRDAEPRDDAAPAAAEPDADGAGDAPEEAPAREAGADAAQEDVVTHGTATDADAAPAGDADAADSVVDAGEAKRGE